MEVEILFFKLWGIDNIADGYLGLDPCVVLEIFNIDFLVAMLLLFLLGGS